VQAFQSMRNQVRFKSCVKRGRYSLIVSEYRIQQNGSHFTNPGSSNRQDTSL
jgi:hypothetical protein